MPWDGTPDISNNARIRLEIEIRLDFDQSMAAFNRESSLGCVPLFTASTQ